MFQTDIAAEILQRSPVNRALRGWSKSPMIFKCILINNTTGEFEYVCLMDLAVKSLRPMTLQYFLPYTDSPHVMVELELLGISMEIGHLSKMDVEPWNPFFFVKAMTFPG